MKQLRKVEGMTAEDFGQKYQEFMAFRAKVDQWCSLDPEGAAPFLGEETLRTAVQQAYAWLAPGNVAQEKVAEAH